MLQIFLQDPYSLPNGTLAACKFPAFVRNARRPVEVATRIAALQTVLTLTLAVT